MRTVTRPGATGRWGPRWFVAVVCACCMCAGGSAFGGLPGQETTATVRGVVLDPSDAVLPGATVTLTSLDTGQGRRAQSSQDGSFQFIAVTPGRYRLMVALAGFASL